MNEEVSYRCNKLCKMFYICNNRQSCPLPHHWWLKGLLQVDTWEWSSSRNVVCMKCGLCDFKLILKAPLLCSDVWQVAIVKKPQDAVLSWFFCSVWRMHILNSRYHQPTQLCVEVHRKVTRIMECTVVLTAVSVVQSNI